MSETVLANDDSARTATGEIKDQTPVEAKEAPKPTETPKETPKEAEAPKEEAKPGDKSLLNQEEPAGVPEKYEFKLPEGFELAEEVSKEVSDLFKDVGLSQTNAQKLVDFYAKNSLQAAEAPYKAWADKQEEWINEIKSDKELGGKLTQVRTTVARAIDGLGDPKLAADFRAAMDYTGAGNNPAFIRAFYKLAQMVTEGAHVQGGGPSPEGQPRQAPRTAGAALYPNLPSG